MRVTFPRSLLTSTAGAQVRAGDGLGNVLDADFGGPHDLVMMLYGEINVFSPDDCRRILSKAFAAILPSLYLTGETLLLGLGWMLLVGVAAGIFPALQAGTIDATEFSMPAIDRTLGFYQIAKYNYFPGWHQQSTTNEVLVN